MTILSSFAFLFFMKLGFWQIHRAEEKAQIILAQKTSVTMPALRWDGKLSTLKPYQAIKVKGRYMDTVFLLDNQHVEHTYGFHVLSPLLLENGKIVMIDRGWVPGDPLRKTFPSIAIPRGKMNVKGNVYLPSSKTWLLGDSLEKRKSKLYILEALDVNLATQVLQKKVYPFIIRLDSGQPYGFVRKWVLVSMPPERHFAYAFQWFVMALVVVILFVALNVRKNGHS